MSRDDEVRRVIAEVDALMDALKANVGSLTAILAGDEQEEGAPA